MLAYFVAGLTVTLLAAAAAEFWKRCFEDPEPLDDRTARDETSPDREQPASETAPAAATLGVRWRWRRHRPSGLQFLRVTVANAGPTAATVTRVRLRMSAELADHAEPPADLLEASGQAAALFGPAAGDALLPLTLEPGGGADAYFPCRDVADWLYGVAEGDNLDRNECRLVPECVDDAGVTHSARRKVDYETWLMHGHGPSLRQYAEGESADAD